MSWLFGAIGNLRESDLQKFSTIHSEPIYSIRKENLYLVAGGIKETLFYSGNGASDEGWIVCGLGITDTSDGRAISRSGEWIKYFRGGSSEFNIDGHFIILQWKGNEIRIENDRLGLRDVYFTDEVDYLLFSTRLDWTAVLSKKSDIDLNEFGSFWLLTNQLSHGSILRNVRRLGPYGTAQIKDRKIVLSNKNWIPAFEKEAHEEELTALLRSFTLFPLYGENYLTLGLSGGLDSRVLLSFLLSSKRPFWGVHTFGSIDQPDTCIAEKIVRELKIDFTQLHEPIPQPEEFLSLLEEYIGQLGPTIPASEILHLPYHRVLYNQNKVIIDGGYGEILRRQFLNRLRFMGRKTLLKKDAEGIFSHLTLNKAYIFNEDVLRYFKENTIRQINDLFKMLPSVSSIGIENWLDLFAIKIKLPNVNGPGQTLLDNISVAYMPYIQPSLLDVGFRVPVSKRRGGKIFRNIIKENYTLLTKYPLVKNQIVYPYKFSSIPAWLWRETKKKMGMDYKDQSKIMLLDGMKDYVYDTVNSTNVKNFELYDIRKLNALTDEYYSGDKSLAGQIDWWLSFEMWRQSLRTK